MCRKLLSVLAVCPLLPFSANAIASSSVYLEDMTTTELAAALAKLQALDAAKKLDQSEKDLLALVEAALTAPPPNGRGFFRRWF